MATMHGGRCVTATLFFFFCCTNYICIATPVALVQTQVKRVPEDDAVDFNTTAFFQYVRETPEPSLLVYNRVPKTGSSTLCSIFQHGARSCPRQLKLLQLNNTYWSDFENYEEEVNELVRGRFREVTHGVVSGHFKFPREPETLPARWDTPRVEFINTVRKCAPRLRSNLLFKIFDDVAARKRIENNTQNAYVEDLFGEGVDPIQCLQDDACLDKFLQRDLSEIIKFRVGNAIENFLGGEHWKEEGNSSAKNAVLERVFAPKFGGVGGYIAVGLLEAQEDSMLLFKCLLPSFFRQGLDVLRTWHTNENDSLNTEGLENPYAKLEARLQDKCSGEDSLYSRIMAIHRLLASKIKADPSLCRKPPQEFDLCDRNEAAQ